MPCVVITDGGEEVTAGYGNRSVLITPSNRPDSPKLIGTNEESTTRYSIDIYLSFTVLAHCKKRK